MTSCHKTKYYINDFRSDCINKYNNIEKYCVDLWKAREYERCPFYVRKKFKVIYKNTGRYKIYCGVEQ